MIQANELRIGNWVYHTNRNGIFTLQVEEVLAKGVRCIYDGRLSFLPYDELQSIPLSEEILLKCGFARGKNNMFFLPIPNLKCEIHATWFHNQYVIELQNHIVPIVTEVEFLHQHQNLYFALTGKELEVEL